MCRSILTSIKPSECANIMDLIQSILVIKNKKEATTIQKLIDKNGYADIYVYCMKDKKNYLYFCYNKYGRGVLRVNEKLEQTMPDCLLNGKVLFKFRCYTVEEITMGEDRRGSLFGSCHYGYHTENLRPNLLMEQSCLDVKDLISYLGRKTGYAIHISDLEIFDKPKELSEFNHFIMSIDWCLVPLERAPQNFCYVEVK